MIAHLRGTIHRLDPGDVTVDVAGVGYRVSVPLSVWDGLQQGQPAMLWISTYVREDRLDLFGFADRSGRTLFEECLKLAGIGPKTALELCAVPRDLLQQAVDKNEPGLLTSIKGVGRKTAEKLLLELKDLAEKHPQILAPSVGTAARHEYDQDAIATLSSLGYDTQEILRALRQLPAELGTTEERVAAVVRSL